MSAPTLDQVWEAAQRIDAAVPREYDRTGTVTNDWCGRIHDALNAQLEAWGIPYDVINQYGCTVSGRHVWHTVMFEDGSSAGRWSDNPTEAALHCAHSWGKRVIESVEDNNGRYLNELRAGEKAAAKIARKIEEHMADLARRYDGTTPAAGGLLDLL